jgi:hypothetical protein
VLLDLVEHGPLQVALLRVVGDHPHVAREAPHLGREQRAELPRVLVAVYYVLFYVVLKA